MFNSSLNTQLDKFEKEVQDTKDKSKELQDKLSIIEKKQNDLDGGLGKLPKDLPEALQKAVDDSVTSITTSIAADAKTIVENADKLKTSSKKVSLTMLSSSNNLERKINRWHYWEYVPIVGYFFTKYCDLLYEKSLYLSDIMYTNDECYENIIRIRSLSNKYVK